MHLFKSTPVRDVFGVRKQSLTEQTDTDTLTDINDPDEPWTNGMIQPHSLLRESSRGSRSCFKTK